MIMPIGPTLRVRGLVRDNSVVTFSATAVQCIISPGDSDVQTAFCSTRTSRFISIFALSFAASRRRAARAARSGRSSAAAAGPARTRAAATHKHRCIVVDWWWMPDPDPSPSCCPPFPPFAADTTMLPLFLHPIRPPAQRGQFVRVRARCGASWSLRASLSAFRTQLARAESSSPAQPSAAEPRGSRVARRWRGARGGRGYKRLARRLARQ